MSTVQNQKILYKNETFTLSTYNGFKIIIRNSDGFINASNVVKQINDKEKTKKEIKKLFKSVQFQDFENNLKTIIQNENLRYNLNEVPKKLRGSYIHPKLINFICFWCSPTYALLVSEIMDSINEQNTAVMNKLIKDLQDENNKLKTKTKVLQNQAIQDIGDNLENSKYVFIDQVDEDTFKIVYDQKQFKNQHYKTFEVLASANIAKNTILKTFYTNGHKRTFKKENLNKVIEIIELNAKK